LSVGSGTDSNSQPADRGGIPSDSRGRTVRRSGAITNGNRAGARRVGVEAARIGLVADGCGIAAYRSGEVSGCIGIEPDRGGAGACRVRIPANRYRETAGGDGALASCDCTATDRDIGRPKIVDCAIGIRLSHGSARNTDDAEASQQG
jgi:hypothetical protein